MPGIICHFLVALLCYCFATGISFAQTRIYVKNHTNDDLKVLNRFVGGDKVSNKAWKKGVESIAPGERKSVLSLIRSGKLNWMDPTPRFVEPGKTVTFHTRIITGNTSSEGSVILLQKLYGEGSTTKMWYAIEGVDKPVVWELQDKEYTRQWHTQSGSINIVFRAFNDGKNTHVEYVFSNL